jgi:hypothetical protein
MNDSESLRLLATLREVTELLASLDLTALPGVAAIQVDTDFRQGGQRGRVQIYARGTDLDIIDAIRTWAVALGGEVLLGDEVAHSRGAYRQIAAVLPLPSGGKFMVWDHLSELHPSPEWTPADSPELIAA